MKANNSNNSKSARKNKNTVLASLEWYQDLVRHVELRDIAPRTRVSYLAWVRRLNEKLSASYILKEEFRLIYSTTLSEAWARRRIEADPGIRASS